MPEPQDDIQEQVDEAKSQQSTRKMPKYKCHKEVSALTIAAIELDGPDHEHGCLRFEEEGYAPIMVNKEWLNKHQPVAGGKYVVYKDGYSSFSPAAAFEEGYTRIE